MELSPEDLPAYVGLFAPGNPDALDRMSSRIEKGEIRLADIRIAPGLTAAVRIAPLGPQSAVLLGPHGEDRAAAALVAEAVEHARSLGVEAILSRPRAHRLGPEYSEALLAQGFDQLGERVEYKSPVEDLPLDDGTPLVWRDLDEVGLEAAAAVLAMAAEGDPHGHHERARPREELAEWLADPVLTDGPECVQVGFEGEREVAFVCAQVQPETGWSRIAYMGVGRTARGRGLGRWVHRRGFRMIREQGGTLYHGGTATDNAGMIRLFETHGCKEYERMFEFEWRAGPETLRGP